MLLFLKVLHKSLCIKYPMINDFFNLIFPKLCNACSNTLLKNESTICTVCQLSLPKTNYHLEEDNPIMKIFWGRVKVDMAASYYLFAKGGKVQNLLHQLKYRGIKDVGVKIGELYGFDLSKSKFYQDIDYIVPIPLHKNKLNKRGFNQSECFAKGLSNTMGIELNASDFIRLVDTKTQTKKSRYKRWENVSDIFFLKENSELAGKTILLVDDVITTGSTMEAAIQVLANNKCKIKVATIASA